MSGKVIFISGIDTDVGKTIATGIYAKRLMEQGFSVITQKMVQTGCEGIAEDLITHRKIQDIALTNDDLMGITCPYVFRYPCSPHLAATLEKREILTAHITQATEQLVKKYNYVLLEGAGGLLVPYNETETTLDYLQQQGYPLILVTSGKLGSLNHTLMSLEICKSRGIYVQELIYNDYPISDPVINKESQRYLTRYLTKHFPSAKFSFLGIQEF